jgi:hypothetical protein
VWMIACLATSQKIEKKQKQKRENPGYMVK